MATLKDSVRGKKLAPSTLDKFGKDYIYNMYEKLGDEYDKYERDTKEVIRGYEVELNKEKSERIRLEARIAQMEKSLSVLTTDDYKIYQILKLYAQGKSIGSCHSILTEMKRVDIDFETIKNLIISLESKELDQKYVEYYVNEVKLYTEDMSSYEERNRIQKLRKLDEFGVIIEQYMSKLRDEGFDEKELEKTTQILSLMKAYTSIVESSSKIMKGVGANSTGLPLENASVEVANETQKENLNILKDFDPTLLVTVN